MNSSVLTMKKACDFGEQKYFYRKERSVSLVNSGVLRMKKTLRVWRTEVFLQGKEPANNRTKTLSAVK